MDEFYFGGGDCVKQEPTFEASEERTESYEAIPSSSSGRGGKRKIKTRLYNENYLAMGFTWCGDTSYPRPECIICGEKLSNESMVPNKLLRHFTTKHYDLAGKTEDYFRKLLEITGKHGSGSVKRFKVSDRALESSYLVAELVAKEMKPHSAAGALILPACGEIVRTVFGTEAEKEIKKIPLDEKTVVRHILDMSEHIERSVADLIGRTNSMFALQVDETTDVEGLNQLLAFVRFAHDEKIVEQYLCCKVIPDNANGRDVFNVLTEYMSSMSLSWENCVGICTDGSAYKTGSLRGFVSMAKEQNDRILSTRCLLRREALVVETIGPELKLVLDAVIKMVDHVKSRQLKSPVFSNICESMGSQHKKLVLHSGFRWLSVSRALSCVYELKEEMGELFQRENETDFCALLRDGAWCAKFAYLSDILEILNKVNDGNRGNDENVLTSSDKLNAMKDKIQLWVKKIRGGNFEMFPNTSGCDKRNDVAETICEHLETTRTFLDGYFPDLSVDNYDWVRNPFVRHELRDIPLKEEEELADLRNNRSLKIKHSLTQIDAFWITTQRRYPAVAKRALSILLQFSTTHLCESSFSALIKLKTSKGRHLKTVDEEIRVALSTIRPNIREICSCYQSNVSHE